MDRIPALNPEAATWSEFEAGVAVLGSFGAAVAEAVTESLGVGARTAVVSTGALRVATVEGGFGEFAEAEVLIEGVSGRVRGDGQLWPIRRVRRCGDEELAQSAVLHGG